MNHLTFVRFTASRAHPNRSGIVYGGAHWQVLDKRGEFVSWAGTKGEASYKAGEMYGLRRAIQTLEREGLGDAAKTLRRRVLAQYNVDPTKLSFSSR